MLFKDFQEYLSFEKKFSQNTITASIKDVKDFQNFLNENETKISSEINYSFIRQWIVNLSENKQVIKKGRRRSELRLSELTMHENTAEKKDSDAPGGLRCHF